MSDTEAMETANAPLPDEVVEATSKDESTEVSTEAEAPKDADGTEEVSAEANDEQEAPEADESEEPKETKNQRKRRMRREREVTTDTNLRNANNEITRLNEQIEALKVPQYNDFQNPDDYTAERAAHAAQKTILEADKRRASGSVQEAQSQAQADMRTAISDTLIDGNATYKDFETSVRKIPLSENMLGASLETENTTDVLYFLGKNPDEAARINRLAPMAQAIEIGKMSANLSSKTKRITKANPPIKTLKGSTASSDKSPHDMNNDEYRAWRMKSSG